MAIVVMYPKSEGSLNLKLKATENLREYLLSTNVYWKIYQVYSDIYKF